MPSSWVYMIDLTLLSVLCVLSIINWVMYKGKRKYVFSKTPGWAKTSRYIIFQLELFTLNLYSFEYCTWVNIATWRDFVRIHFWGIVRNPCMLILFLFFPNEKTASQHQVSWNWTGKGEKKPLSPGVYDFLFLSQYFSYGFNVLRYKRKCPSLQ